MSEQDRSTDTLEASRARRERMVRRQLEGRGIRDPQVLGAMRDVPREVFVPAELESQAYEDAALPIGVGQTISQPYVVALMTQAAELRPADVVLEIGTGSGYGAAVLSRIASAVYTIDRHEPLVVAAQRRFDERGYGNIETRVGDGTLGWAEHAPYDAIIVTAGGPDVPLPLREQLAIGGRLVMPVGDDPRWQRLLRITRVAKDRFEREDLGGVAFVPLIGERGWSESSGGG